MSRQTSAIPPLLAFVDPARKLWGAALGEQPRRAIVGGVDGPAPEAAVEPTSEATVELSWQPAKDQVTSADPGGLELVTVTGQVVLPGQPAMELSAGGVHFGGGAIERLDSARLLVGWFSEEQAVGLLSVRPQGSRGQDRDTLSAVSLGERAGVTVFDPRLSSTYGPGGRLRRVGVELWLGETEGGDQYSHRVAGEATGSEGRLQDEGLATTVWPVRCHSRAGDGIGLYALVQPA